MKASKRPHRLLCAQKFHGTSCCRACQACSEVLVELCPVQIAANEDQLVDTFLSATPGLPHACCAAAKGQQHVDALEEVPAGRSIQQVPVCIASASLLDVAYHAMSTEAGTRGAPCCLELTGSLSGLAPSSPDVQTALTALS